jgi:hypothetical protein
LPVNGFPNLAQIEDALGIRLVERLEVFVAGQFADAVRRAISA